MTSLSSICEWRVVEQGDSGEVRIAVSSRVNTGSDAYEHLGLTSLGSNCGRELVEQGDSEISVPNLTPGTNIESSLSVTESSVYVTDS